MESDAVAQVFEFGAWRFAQNSPTLEGVADTASEVYRQRYDQVAALGFKTQ
jgi:hypothetical protein